MTALKVRGNPNPGWLFCNTDTLGTTRIRAAEGVDKRES